ncbi:MAG: hypothetical protein GY705_32080, partial [Bacteroidetes bacterium]|nr:hypothetical protein [Bacteroidota bacterium]
AMGSCGVTKARAQTEIPPALAYKIKKEIFKNITIGEIYFKKRRFQGARIITSYRFFRFPGFGYVPDELDCNFSVPSLSYPKSDWTLYEVSFLEKPKNDSLVSWSHEKGLAIPTYRGPVLVAVNKKNEIKFISSGGLFEHPIAQDFDLDPKDPASYIPFLRLKLYSSHYEEIEYVRKEGKKLVFLCSRTFKDTYSDKSEYYIDPDNPDHYSSKYVGETIYSDYTKKPKLKFTDLEDKKRYLLNALMKNIYMYKIHRLPKLVDYLNVDTTTYLFKEGESKIDSLLPAYDEYFPRIGLVTFRIRYTEGNCPDAWPSFIDMIGTGNYDEIAGSLMYNNVQFYRFYKDTLDVLFKRKTGKYYDIDPYSRYDYFYQPEVKKKHQEWQRKNQTNISYPPPPPPPEPMPEYPNHFGGNPKCLPYKPPFDDEWKGRLDYYLLALDKDTRKVYFISGKDIYLSKAIHLYPPVQDELPENIV